MKMLNKIIYRAVAGFIMSTKNRLFKNNLFVPYQKALKLGLSVNEIIFPAPKTETLTTAVFLSFSKFSLDI